MCDTFVVMSSSTTDGSVIFGKNTDREPNEAHLVEIVPAADHAPDSQVMCTYISIPQVAHTHKVLLARPFWMWGAEMGVNEHGVAIGNEAVFTRVPYETGPGLTGMDFLRLALERASSAYEALTTITILLERYGQGGNCGFTHPFYYHNSFILADAREAWVLETAGRHWAAEKVRDIRSISNGLTIGAQWDLASVNLVKHAIDQGWCRRREDFDFARCYSDLLYTRMSDSNRRQVCTTQLLQQQKGRIDPRAAMAVLRSHGIETPASWSPDAGVTGASVCMHASAGPVRVSQSVGSLVAHLRPGNVLAWVTATSAPCTSIFKPVWMDAGLPDMGPQPSGTYSPDCLWWQHEVLHRTVLQDFPGRLPLLEQQRNVLEKRFIEQAAGCAPDSSVRLALTGQCFRQADEMEQRCLVEVRAAPITRRPTLLHRVAWQGFNRQAKLPPPGIQLARSSPTARSIEERK